MNQPLTKPKLYWKAA